MKNFLFTIAALAGILLTPIGARAFPAATNAATFSTPSQYQSYRDFNWRWAGSHTRVLDIQFTSSDIPIVILQLTNPRGGIPYLTVYTESLELLSNGNTRLFVEIPRTNIPPNGAYYSEFIAATSETVTNEGVTSIVYAATASLASGMINTEWSAFETATVDGWTPVIIQVLATNGVQTSEADPYFMSWLSTNALFTSESLGSLTGAVTSAGIAAPSGTGSVSVAGNKITVSFPAYSGLESAGYGLLVDGSEVYVDTNAIATTGHVAAAISGITAGLLTTSSAASTYATISQLSDTGAVLVAQIAAATGSIAVAQAGVDSNTVAIAGLTSSVAAVSAAKIDAVVASNSFYLASNPSNFLTASDAISYSNISPVVWTNIQSNIRVIADDPGVDIKSIIVGSTNGYLAGVQVTHGGASLSLWNGRSTFSPSFLVDSTGTNFVFSDGGGVTRIPYHSATPIDASLLTGALSTVTFPVTLATTSYVGTVETSLTARVVGTGAGATSLTMIVYAHSSNAMSVAELALGPATNALPASALATSVHAMVVTNLGPSALSNRVDSMTFAASDSGTNAAIVVRRGAAGPSATSRLIEFESDNGFGSGVLRTGFGGGYAGTTGQSWPVWRHTTGALQFFYGPWNFSPSTYLEYQEWADWSTNVIAAVVGTVESNTSHFVGMLILEPPGGATTNAFVYSPNGGGIGTNYYRLEGAWDWP